jgi:4-methylaminobutanoate oxidase (formaldehyde-forming)
VEASRGSIEAETVVLACGLWTSELARRAGASVPLYPAEHVWVMTEEAEGADERMPFLRDLDGYLYIRHYRGRYLVGAFEPKGRPKPVGEITTGGFASSARTGTTSRRCWPTPGSACPSSRRSASRTTCARRRASRRTRTSSWGTCRRRRGLFVAAGFNSQGIIFGPGAGRAAAEWIVAGHPRWT